SQSINIRTSHILYIVLFYLPTRRSYYLFIQYMDHFKQELLNDDTLDTRMFAARVVEEAWKWMADKSPAIFVFYSSLYSPRIELSGKTENEQILIDALEHAVKSVQPNYDHPIALRNFFPVYFGCKFYGVK